MRKFLSLLVVSVFVVVALVLGTGCGSAVEIEGEIAQEPTTTAAEEAVQEETVDEPSVVAEDVYTVGFVDGLLGPWAGLIQKAYVDYFADKPNFEAKTLQVQRSGDTVETLELVESLVTEQVDGILMVVFTSEALLETLNTAREAGIVFGTVGTTLAVDKFAPEAPDFVVAGVNYPPAYNIAKRAIEERLGGSGKVVIINGLEGSDVADDRKKGFEDACAEFPGIEVLFSDYVGWLDDTSYDTMSDLLVKHPEIDLVLTATDPAANGAYEAAAAVGRGQEMYFTGWDLYDWYADLMRENEQFYGTVAALPYFMGTVSSQLLEHSVSNPEYMRMWIDTEFPVATMDNLDQFQVIGE